MQLQHAANQVQLQHATNQVKLQHAANDAVIEGAGKAEAWLVNGLQKELVEDKVLETNSFFLLEEAVLHHEVPSFIL